MKLKKGVFIAYKKDGTLYYRSSMTFKQKHISLGSFSTEEDAHKCYLEGIELISSNDVIESYDEKKRLISFEKWVSIINFRDNNMYFKNPIYLKPKYFLYYYDKNTCYKFDVDDLFYYSKHKIMKRNGHLFVADYGMQVNILSRYGIKNYAVAGKDYIFMNGDSTDFRYKNIKVINRYNGVSVNEINGQPIYIAKIHINGDYIIGRYTKEEDAAIAYNKAGELLVNAGIISSYQENYIENLNSIQYASRHNLVKISKNILKLISEHK